MLGHVHLISQNHGEQSSCLQTVANFRRSPFFLGINGRARKLPGAEILAIGDIQIGITHDPYHPPAEFNVSNCQVIINGHTHRALIEEKKQILYINPGSAGQPRSNRQASVAILRIMDSLIKAEIIPLEPAVK